MEIKQALIRALVNWLPADEQERMAADVVAWLCADMTAARRQEKVEKLAPRLLKRMRAGQLGLQLVIYYHLMRLPPLRWLHCRDAPAETPTRLPTSWLVLRWF
jgi:hypothetical protein